MVEADHANGLLITKKVALHSLSSIHLLAIQLSYSSPSFHNWHPAHHHYWCVALQFRQG